MTVNRALQADKADFAQNAQSAKNAEQAQQATYAMVAKEAERLNVAGNIFYIDAVNHLVIMYQETTDPSQGIRFDIANRIIWNVENIYKPDGTPYSTCACMFADAMDEFAVSPMERLQSRVSALETQLASFTQI
jgi:hypothetical protein